jgi:excisionase family DNA binding protein
MNDPLPTTGLTPNELAKLLRVSADRIRNWIKTGKLGAVNVAEYRCAKARFIILPHHLAEFERQRQVTPQLKPARRRRRIGITDFYPD